MKLKNPKIFELLEEISGIKYNPNKEKQEGQEK